MSTATDLAELDAAIAEAELSDDEAEIVRRMVGETDATPAEAVDAAIAMRDPEPEPPAPPSPEPPSGEPTEQQLKALDRATDRHLEKVRGIMGAHVAGFETCSKCGGIGLTPPGPQPRTHDWFKACETCEGFGEVLTGSHREGHTSRDCPRCKGRGYVEALDQAGTPLAEGGGAQPAPIVAPPTANGETPPAPPAPTSSELNFGAPAWMGDPSLSR